MFQRLLVFTLLFGLCCSQPVTPYAIDQLEVFSGVVRCEADGATNSNNVQMSPSFVGNRQVNCLANGAGLGLEVSGQGNIMSLQCNIGSGATGYCSFDYMNIPNINFRELGCGCFDITEEAPDRIHNLRIDTWSGGTMATSEANGLTALNQGEQRRLCIPLGGNMNVYDSVTRIEFTIDGSIDSQLDNVISNFCCLPTTDTWHSVEPAGLVAPGECSTVTWTISNPMREPLMTRDLDFEFATPMGAATASTLSCDGGINAFVDGSMANTRVFGTLSLPPGESRTCSYEVCWETEGTADLALSVVDSGITSHSHNGGSREGTDDLCTPPEPTQVQVQIPPSTLPPTTIPPTTFPPTEPPPTFVCVAPRVDKVTGACDCAARFPCEMTGPTEFHCDTDEWYCIFIASADPPEEYFVEYGPHTCSCFY